MTSMPNVTLNIEKMAKATKNQIDDTKINEYLNRSECIPFLMKNRKIKIKKLIFCLFLKRIIYICVTNCLGPFLKIVSI